MGRRPCCEKVGIKRGPWSAEEDNKLINFILANGQCCWRALPKLAGLLRCGKSCRLRWTNYLRPDLKRGLLSESEEKMVIDMHAKLGNKWSKIASNLPGRTDNEIKNHWNTHIKKKLKKMGIDPATHKPLSAATEPPKKPPQNQQEVKEDDESKDKGNQITMQSSIMTESSKEAEDNMKVFTSSTTSFEFATLMEQVNDNNNGFGIDEVPLVQPHEIEIQVPPTAPSTSAAFSPSYSSTSSTSIDFMNGSSTLFSSEDMVDQGIQQDFQNFDWQLVEDCINMSGLWDVDDFNSLDPSYLSTIDNNDISGYCHYPRMV